MHGGSAAFVSSQPAWLSTHDPDDEGIIVDADGWSVCYKENTSLEQVAASLKIVDVETDHLWFKELFATTEHWVNFAGRDRNLGSVVVALTKAADDDTLRAVIYTKDGRRFVEMGGLGAKLKGKLTKKLIGEVDPLIDWAKLRAVDDDRLRTALLRSEEKSKVTKYKFGLLYVKQGQLIEEEMFANDGNVIDHSPEYQRFCDWLGDTVTLQGWSRYRAGLDVTSGGTGTFSIYREWRGFEVMWHVATLLPHFEADFQCLQRKRHLGNDICMVVFSEHESYVPTCVYSQFNHCVIVVNPVPKDLTGGRMCYRISQVCKNDVGAYSPKIPRHRYFEESDSLRDWLYARLINGERTAVQNASGFTMTRTRTHQLFLDDLCNDFAPE